MKINLRALRHQKQKSSKEVANNLGISVKTLMNYETGKTILAFDKAMKLSEIYQVPLNEIDFLNTKHD